MPNKAASLFVNHGAGPLPYLYPNDPAHKETADFFKIEARKVLNLDNHNKPIAIVLITAHWENDVVTVSSSEKHKLLYDYYNFPKPAYDLKYNARGSPEIAEKIKNLLSTAGIKSRLDPNRGWDHGTFIPLKLIAPEEEIPIVQVSLVNTLDPRLHYKIGEALQSLRDENIAILGSGMTFHNNFGSKDGASSSVIFDEALTKVVLQGRSEREEGLANWEKLPAARECHQREEHLLPLHVVAGAGGSDEGYKVKSFKGLGVTLSSFAF